MGTALLYLFVLFVIRGDRNVSPYNLNHKLSTFLSFLLVGSLVFKGMYENKSYIPFFIIKKDSKVV